MIDLVLRFFLCYSEVLFIREKVLIIGVQIIHVGGICVFWRSMQSDGHSDINSFEVEDSQPQGFGVALAGPISEPGK